LGHVRVPQGHRHRHQLSGQGNGAGGERRAGQQGADQQGRAETRRPQREHQDRLHREPAVDHRGDGGEQGVLRDRPRRGIAEAERRVRGVRTRRAHRVAQQQVAGPEQRAPDQQGQCRAVSARHEQLSALPPPRALVHAATLRTRRTGRSATRACAESRCQGPLTRTPDPGCDDGPMSVTRRPLLVADMTLVTAGAMTANVAGYLLQLLAGRWLGVNGYSEFASLLAVPLLCAVPALALQNVVAREFVRGAPVAALRALQSRCAAIVAALALALVPVVTFALDVGVLACAGALAAAPAQVLLTGEQGILQGQRRFRVLAVVLGLAGISRVVPALALLAANAGAGP